MEMVLVGLVLDFSLAEINAYGVGKEEIST